MNEAPAKRLHIKTYGCQMNVYDSERMADILRPLGYALTDEVGRADLVILNTCHIREKASEKVYSELGRLKELREDRLRQGGGRLGIGVAGCVAQAEGQELMRRQSAVDFVVGPQALHQIPELIARQTWAMGERLAADFSPVDKFDALPKAREAIGPAAFLTVQEGCDKFCTFCVVPYTRGAEWSRPVADILDEARRLADQGVRELTLLGQNVNNFNGPDASGQPSSLGRLLSDLAEIPGLERLRYTTSHPNDMGEDLIAAHRDLPQVMPYLHLPVQSGSDRILKAMNRKHTAAAYIDVIDRLRQARPDIAISGDFIVGFPGELDADFEATLALIERVNYASAFSFKYSPRPGTPAAGMTTQVDEAVKDERLQRLQALIQAQFLRFNRAQVGKVLPVLLEKPGRHAGQAVGKSPYLQSVHIDGAAGQIGQIVDVRIRAAVGNSLAGDLVLEPMSCPA